MIDTVVYDYPCFHLSVDCFFVSIVQGTPVLKEHEVAKWLTRDTLDSVEWLPADWGLIDKLRETTFWNVFLLIMFLIINLIINLIIT